MPPYAFRKRFFYQLFTELRKPVRVFLVKAFAHLGQAIRQQYGTMSFVRRGSVSYHFPVSAREDFSVISVISGGNSIAPELRPCDAALV